MNAKNFSQDYVVAMYGLVENLTNIGKVFSAEEKTKLFCWLLNHHNTLNEQEHVRQKYPDGMPFEWFREVMLESQITVLAQALNRNLIDETITGRITIEFDIDAGMLKAKGISAEQLMDYVTISDDDTVDGFRIGPSVPWCDVTADFFLSNGRIVESAF